MSNLHRKRVIQKRARRERAHRRVRTKVQGSEERPRLCVTKSLRYIYAQVIDDRSGRTLAQANSLEKGLREGLDGACGNKEAARTVGEKVAERSLELGNQEGGLRSRRVRVPRQDQGSGRRRPRERIGVLGMPRLSSDMKNGQQGELR